MTVERSTTGESRRGGNRTRSVAVLQTAAFLFGYPAGEQPHSFMSDKVFKRRFGIRHCRLVSQFSSNPVLVDSILFAVASAMRESLPRESSNHAMERTADRCALDFLR